MRIELNENTARSFDGDTITHTIKRRGVRIDVTRHYELRPDGTETGAEPETSEIYVTWDLPHGSILPPLHRMEKWAGNVANNLQITASVGW